MTLNCSDGWRMRLLEALAAECAQLGTDVAQLGEAVSGGHATLVTLQGFDRLSQSAASLARLLERTCATRRDIVHCIDQVPLPAIRQRLRAALDLDGVITETDDTVIWLEAP